MLKFVFAILSYLVGLSSLCAFFWYMQFGIDQQVTYSSIALIHNALAFLIFPLQHSLFPREGIKKWTQQHFDPLLQRPFYVATSGAAMWFVIAMWRPVGPYVYHFKNGYFFDAIFYAALLLIILSTVQLDHSSMFGLKQGYYSWKKIPFVEGKLKTDGIYGFVRHPITSFFILALWSHSTMTIGRLEFNLLFSGYALIGTVFEDRSLMQTADKEYLAYRKTVPGFIPRLFFHGGSASPKKQQSDSQP